MPVCIQRIGGMGVVTRLRLLIDDDGELYECRNCGEKFDSDCTECSTCDSMEIAHYEF
ncbi:hypothetical protein [Natronorubrum halalkaliphilum]|uniref:hypothetical protein n=1 Tax=Natronorubrum halalkaliphilum TaxID=2691917 RepID=UPI0019161745|nr:hypothetical protein [Natronorubrum halalkaliphilum]